MQVTNGFGSHEVNLKLKNNEKEYIHPSRGNGYKGNGKTQGTCARTSKMKLEYLYIGNDERKVGYIPTQIMQFGLELEKTYWLPFLYNFH